MKRTIATSRSEATTTGTVPDNETKVRAQESLPPHEPEENAKCAPALPLRSQPEENRFFLTISFRNDNLFQERTHRPRHAPAPAVPRCLRPFTSRLRHLTRHFAPALSAVAWHGPCGSTRRGPAGRAGRRAGAPPARRRPPCVSGNREPSHRRPPRASSRRSSSRRPRRRGGKPAERSALVQRENEAGGASPPGHVAASFARSPFSAGA